MNLTFPSFQYITSRQPVHEEFHVIGYSFGGLVALELVKLLEKEGRKGRLWLIDSSPEFLQTMTKVTLMTTEQAEDELQVKIILRFLDLIWPQATKGVTKCCTSIFGFL